tara:strand:+ start:68 stop:544 length:477 start_codon:yes stop_codon:yes gene_type:complete
MQYIDNFLPLNIFKEIHGIVFNKSFNWNLYQGGAVEGDGDYFFGHELYNDRRQLSEHFHTIVMPIIGRWEFNYLLRAKINCQPKTKEHEQSSFHIDRKIDHTTMLLYLNTNNGYTLFKTGEKVSSVANRCLIFNGHKEHAAVSQTDTNVRVNININIR